MTAGELALLVAAGLAGGVVNTLAGGGSLLTVPLLVMLGLPGNVANGTNRVGILVQNLAAVWRFRREGIWDLQRARLEIAAVSAGALVGAFLVSRLSHAAFERAFAVVMVVMLVPTLRRPIQRSADAPRPAVWLRAVAFFVVGLYGGAFQAGVGVLLVVLLSWAGFDLVRANGVKVLLNSCFTLLAIPVFVAEHLVDWRLAVGLAVGFGLGGELGARLAVHGGERVIRPVLAIAVLALAGRMLGLYG